MAKGDVYPSEKKALRDAETGVTVTRLTNHLCHANHLYFTHWPYYDSGRKMLFHSDRGNARNLFGIDLESGEIRQLTEFGPGQDSPGPFSAVVSRVRDEAYFWAGWTLHAIDLSGLEERVIWRCDDGPRPGTPNCSADGRFIYFGQTEDLSSRLTIDLPHGYLGFDEYWAARPHCRILRVRTAGGEPQLIWEEDYWIGHINCSPAEPDLLTFCHEGPWDKVDNRIWGLDANKRRAWRIRPSEDGSFVGHEYWFADGSRVGYHGASKDGKPFWGHADPGGGDYADYPLSRGSMHFCSLDAELIVSDGGRDDPYIILWRSDGGGCEPRLLCKHRGSFHSQRLHVHPTITPDGKAIIFTSDLGDYGQIHRVEIPDFDSLPQA